METTRDEIIARMREQERVSDRNFAAQLLRDIPYYHRLYAKYGHPESLEAAKYAGIVLDTLYKKYEVDKSKPLPTIA